MERIAIYPGTFDPWTNGHQDVLRAAIQMFDHVFVAFLTNVEKTPMFSIEDRFTMVRLAVDDIQTTPFLEI